ncbi:pirin family protein [Marinicrinis lubricantis]|uniref:Pirin family protein n=1 Tax=Marinicrinis lubricantis TaxID=2086470 RepID=A0ABW1IU95_9BACL
MQLLIYPPHLQGVGAFDGGAIQEQKPVAFPHERSVVKRVGPLFYWSWFHAEERGHIPLHPHSGFEIMTYVIHGKAEHKDTLGTHSTVGAGGAQVMQTGSGVSHEENMIGPRMEGFQIWFEPYLKESMKLHPAYAAYEEASFPTRSNKGFSMKTVLGEGSPITITADARMWDVEVAAGTPYMQTIPKDRALAVLAVRGGGVVSSGGKEAKFHVKDFILLNAYEEAEVRFQAHEDAGLRLVLIEVPITVDYPLYRK